MAAIMAKRAGKPRHNCIRGGLQAHREKSSGSQNRNRQKAFGIYQTLTPESAADVLAATKKAIPPVEEYLKRRIPEKHIAQLVMRSDFGVTYVPRNKIKHAMGYRFMKNIVSIDNVEEKIDRYNYANKQPLEVPIDGFGWYGEDRTMVARLGSSPGLQRLYDTAPLIGGFLRLNKRSGIQVLHPDHVSVFKYGDIGDHMDLSEWQRGEISEITQDIYKQEGVVSLQFGGLVLGNSYSEPRTQG